MAVRNAGICRETEFAGCLQLGWLILETGQKASCFLTDCKYAEGKQCLSPFVHVGK